MNDSCRQTDSKTAAIPTACPYPGEFLGLELGLGARHRLGAGEELSSALYSVPKNSGRHQR